MVDHLKGESNPNTYSSGQNKVPVFNSYYGYRTCQRCRIEPVLPQNGNRKTSVAWPCYDHGMAQCPLK